MPMEFLRKIKEEDLPVNFESPADIDKVCVLRAAGLVAAMTLVIHNGGAKKEVARVLAITPSGRNALAGRFHHLR